MNDISTSAPAKLILIGEHSVVYNQPALAVSLNMRLHIKLKPAEYFSISSKSDQEQILDLKKLRNKLFFLEKAWQQYDLDGNFQFVKKLLKGKSLLLKLSLVLTLEKLHLLETNDKFNLNIASDIPSGSGLGSSAAMCAASAAAILNYYNNYDQSLLEEIVKQLEKYQHGHPSGIDLMTVINGGLIYFQKTPQLISIKKIDLEFLNKQNIFLIDSGRPKESTGEMVNKVAQLNKKNPIYVSKINKLQGRLVNQLLIALENQNLPNIRKIIYTTQNNLQKLGVVSEKTKQFIQEIEDVNGVAKICGAGGNSVSSGMVLSLFLTKDKLQSLINKYNFKIYPLNFSKQGLLLN